MKLYHVTGRRNRDRILAEGFKHGHTGGVRGMGVWFSDGLWIDGVCELGDAGLLASGKHVFVIESPEALLDQFKFFDGVMSPDEASDELDDDGEFVDKNTVDSPVVFQNEWCIPSEVVNEIGFREVTVAEILATAAGN